MSYTRLQTGTSFLVLFRFTKRGGVKTRRRGVEKDNLTSWRRKFKTRLDAVGSIMRKERKVKREEKGKKRREKG